MTASVTPELDGMSTKYKPDLGIDIAPLGTSIRSRTKIPPAIPNTFYDLFYPNTNRKADGVLPREKRFYTFSALLQTYMDAAMPKIFSGAFAPKYEFSRREAFTFFKNVKHSRAFRNLSVKKVGNEFEIKLPIFSLVIEDVLELAEGFPDGATETEFFRTFWQSSNLLIPIQFGQKAYMEVSRNEVSPTLASGYSKAEFFYKKYVKSFIIESDTVLPDRISEDGSNIQAARDGRNISRRPFSVSVVVTLPVGEAKFYVQSETPKASEVLDFIHGWYLDGFTAVGKQLFPTYRHSLSSIKDKNAPFEKMYQPKTNEEGIALSKNNKYLYLPSLDNIATYEELLEEALYDEETGTYNYDRKQGKPFPNNILVYTDWVNKRISYTTADSKIKTLDLRTIYPVRATNYLRALDRKVGKGLVNSLFYIESKVRRLGFSKIVSTENFANLRTRLNAINPYAAAQSHAQAISLFGTSPVQGLIAFYQNFIFACNDPSHSMYGNTNQDGEGYDQLVKVGVDLHLRDTVSGGIFYLLTNYLREIYQFVFEEGNVEAYINEVKTDVPTSLEELGLLTTLSKVREISTLRKISNEETKAYREQDDIDVAAPVPLKNFEGVEAFMRHQANTIKKLDKAPNFAIVGVSAGGGKTLIALADILQAINAGYVKKPLVMCPSNLIKDYVNEGIFAGNGKLNVIGLDGSVFSNYAEVGKDSDGNTIWNYSKLDALINKAPPNTIFVLGYDVIASATSNKFINVYGSEAYESYSHLDFLATCGFDGVWADESHYLKGTKSLRVRVNEVLLAPIPYKRLLSGTIVPNLLPDLVQQVSLFDPSILGTEKEFRIKYDIDGRESGTFTPREGALPEITKILKENTTYINVGRKEWAAFLPRLAETEVYAEMTPNQKLAYRALIGEAVDQMQAENPELEALLNDDSVGDENDEEIENIMATNSNLAKVEGFLSNPASFTEMDGIKEYLKKPEDLESPKGKVINKLLRMHLDSPEKYPGKILVFCNTHLTVAGIYNALDPDIKQKTIYYSAQTQAEQEREFNTDDNKRILLGVSQSLDTGLNLQAADTLIRADVLWTPGRLEQGNARINRPKLKGDDIRLKTGIFCYYVVVDGTIDTIKWAKLTSKTVALTKFYNEGTEDAHLYKGVGLDKDGNLIEPLKVSFAMLRQGLLQSELTEYADAYYQMRETETIIFDKYREQHDTQTARVPVKHTGLLEGSKLVKNVPYIAGAGVYNANELGLVPYLVYKRQWQDDNPGEEFVPESLSVHTEFGDGSVIKETLSTVQIRYPSGVRKALNPNVVFVISKKLTSTAEIKNQLAKATGLPFSDVKVKTWEQEQKLERVKQREEKELKLALKRQARELKRREREKEAEERKQKKMQKLDPREVVDTEEEETTSLVSLRVRQVNDMLALTILSDDAESEVGLFKKYGFRRIKPYLAGYIRRKSSLTELLDKMHSLYEDGVIDMAQDTWDMWSDIEYEFSQGRSKLLQVNHNPDSKLKNFLRFNFRKVRVPNMLRALPLIEDKQLYMVVDLNSHISTTVNRVRRLRVQGVKWEVRDSELLALFRTKTEIANVVKSMKKDGWEIEDEKELKRQVKNLRVVKRKSGPR